MMPCCAQISFIKDGPVKQFESLIATNQALLINQLNTNKIQSLSPEVLYKDIYQDCMLELDSLKNTYPQDEKNQVLDYYYANRLNQLSQQFRDDLSRDAMWFRLASEVILPLAIPSESILQQSQESRMYLYHLSRYHLDLFSIQVKEEGLTIVPQRLGKSLEEIKSFTSQYGEVSMQVWFGERILPDYALKAYYSDQLMKALKQPNKEWTTLLLDKLSTTFPTYDTLPEITKEVQKYLSQFEENRKNPNIVFLENPEQINTLEKLLAPYKGKLVYLDFWGSWCGPCLQEMRSKALKALKQEFSNQDIVWLYLAGEYDHSQRHWEPTILQDQIEGIHLYKSMIELEPFWEALLHTKNTSRSFPTYALFGRKGELIQANAPRPSEIEKLRTLFKETLKK